MECKHPCYQEREEGEYRNYNRWRNLYKQEVSQVSWGISLMLPSSRMSALDLGSEVPDPHAPGPLTNRSLSVLEVGEVAIKEILVPGSCAIALQGAMSPVDHLSQDL